MEDDEQAVFSITKVNYEPPRPVIQMVTSNNILVMALDNGKLIRLDLRDTSDLRDIDVGPFVRKMFLDPTGNHLIISTVEDTQYLHRNWNSPKSLRSLKNIVVTSVGWDLSNSDPLTTGTILLGTAAGQIYELSIEASASNMLRGADRGLKLLWKFPEAEMPTNISSNGGPVPSGRYVLEGLGWFKVPGTTMRTTHCVFAVSASKMWMFIGGANFETLFSAYQQTPPYGVWHTLPNNITECTHNVELHFFHKYVESIPWPKSLAWFLAPRPSVVFGNQGASPGSSATSAYQQQLAVGQQMEIAWLADFSFSDIASGKLDALMQAMGVSTSSGNAPSSGILPSSSMLSNMVADAKNKIHEISVIDSNRFNHVPLRDAPPDAAPVSMILTEFHLIVLFHNGLIQFISRLTNELVFECKCNIGRSTMRGLAHDPRTNITFAYTDSQLFELHIENESRNVWRMYLSKNQFDSAESYAREDWQRDVIWTAWADTCYAQKQHKKAAEIYAKTSRSFEEVTLKFLNENATSALMIYLKAKLDQGRFQSEMQPTVLCTWLAELYLATLNDLEAQQQLLIGTTSSSIGSSKPSGPSLQTLKESFTQVQHDFKEFLRRYESTLNRPTIMGLITSYGRVDEMLEYATVVKAWDVVIGWYVQQHEWEKALKELLQRRLTALLYKHCTVLMQNAPVQTTETLIAMAQSDVIDPREILPSLTRYQEHRKLESTRISTPSTTSASKTGGASINHAIRFLEFVIHRLGNKDSAVHNLLIALYAEEEPEESSGAEDRLLKFVESSVACIDLEYALGLCEKHHRLKAQVAISSKMGLYEEAVQLALDGNFVDLARTTADAVEDPELRKKLWLKLTQHMIKKDAAHGGDIAKVMKFISQSGGILQIEDVLPIFPPFVVIDDFKEEICRSLKEYNSHINDLVVEIEESTNAAQAIRADIDKLPNKFGAVSSNQTCEICKTAVLSKSFYLFPCTHVFHQNCLIEYLKPLILDPAEKNALITLSDALLQKRILLAQKAAMERDRDSAFAAANPTTTSSSILPSFFDSKDGPGLSSLFAGTPLSGLNLPFGKDSNPQPSTVSNQPATSSVAPQNPVNASINPSANIGGTAHNPSSYASPGFANKNDLPPISVLASWTEKQLQDALDNYIACECPLCGDLMIDTVPRPLIDPRTTASWDLPKL